MLPLNWLYKSSFQEIDAFICCAINKMSPKFCLYDHYVLCSSGLTSTGHLEFYIEQFN